MSTKTATAEGTDTDTAQAVEGIVMTRTGWNFGTITKDLGDNKARISYENENGKMVPVTRDITDPNQWQEGVTVLPEVTDGGGSDAAAKPVKAKATKPKADPNEIVEYATGAAKRGHNRFSADAKFHVCTGACGKRLPTVKFPTITGTNQRGSECRDCRDLRRGVKAPKDDTTDAKVAAAK